MKKVLLLLSAGFVSFGAWAQENKSGSLMLANPQQEHKTELPVPGMSKQDLMKFREERNKTLKTTAGGTRVFNYLRYLAGLDPSVQNNWTLPYMWFDFNGMAVYQGTSGIEVDTIPLSSVATVLHPQSALMNDPYYFDDLYPTGTAMLLTDADPYVLDSVSISAVYGRNPDKYDVIDTIRFAIVYGDGTAASNLQIGNFTGMTSSYGYDTVSYVRIPYDSFAHTATNLQGGPNVVIKDLYLDSFATTANTQLPVFTVPVNLSIPAGNYVAVSATFISGDPTFVPYTDTVFVGDQVSQDRPFKYGMIRPYIYEEKLGSFPTYHPGDRNSGGFKFLPVTNGWNAAYIPTVAFNSGDGPYEFLDMDFFVSCATCDEFVGVNAVSNIITSAAAYPNPATDFVRIPVTVSQSASVKVSLVNTVGQVVDARDLGTVAAGTSAAASFSTANLAPGVYLYTVDAAGQRQTGRFVVAR